MGRKKKKTYHHGALRRALLDVAEDVLEERGVEQFTMRECARRAGVSHGAPAHHFNDVAGLLSELAAESFEALDALMTRYRQKSKEAYDQFIATGLAYADYALAHRARFQLMFRSDRLDFENPRLAQASARTYGQLLETLAALPPPEREPPLTLDERAGLAWSIVHGFAVLMLENELFAETVGRSRKQAHDALLRMLLFSGSVFDERRAS